MDQFPWNDPIITPFITAGNMTKTYKNNVVENSATNITYYITATIPMRFLHKFLVSFL